MVSISRLNFFSISFLMFSTFYLSATFDFVSRSSSFELTQNDSKFLITSASDVSGWDQHSIIRPVGPNNSWLSDGEILGYEIEDSAIPPHLIYSNSNAIVTLQKGGGGGGEINPLTQGPLTSDISFEGSFHIPPGKRIEVAANITIDGNGSLMIFSNGLDPQFVVRAGCTVTLKNIYFDKINQNTFGLIWRAEKTGPRAGWQLIEGQINIAENVGFGISEDVIFSHGLINILNKSDGGQNIFILRGFEGIKKVAFNPSADYRRAVLNANLSDRISSDGEPILFKLNDNVGSIQTLNLYGIEHIGSTISNFAGALELIAGTCVNIGNMEKPDDKETCDKVFVINGLNNQFHLLKDDLSFTGQLLYADDGDNSLEIVSMFSEKIEKPMDDPSRNIPRVNFGTGFVNLTSLNGKATLIFGDSRVRINNSNNGFVVKENSCLVGNYIEVYGDYIWDLYDPSTSKGPFIINVNQLVAPDPTLNHVPIISGGF